jgi:arylsulfatase A-like enzyme
MPPSYKDKLTEIKDPARRVWAAQLRNMDDAVGAVLSKVRDAGIEDDTLIFFLGDNGGYPLGGVSPNRPLRGKKADTFEGGVRIPFLVQWKGKLPAGKVYDKTLISLDILPTAVAVAGGKTAKNVEGLDILPYLKGSKRGSPHEKLFWRWIEKHGARVGDWKLVQNGDGKEMLFNLADDIGEKNDLAAKHPDKLKELRDAYKAWDAKNVPPKWLDSRRKNPGGAAK